MKLIVVLLLLVILYCLGSGVYYLVKEGLSSRKLARALTWRIILSIALFLFLIFSFWMGWTHPHPLELFQPTVMAQ